MSLFPPGRLNLTSRGESEVLVTVDHTNTVDVAVTVSSGLPLKGKGKELVVVEVYLGVVVDDECRLRVCV